MNNLYSWGLSDYLPYDEFKQFKNVDGFDVNSISEKRETGYFLEVDLKYLDELHELQNGYPLAPEKLAFSSEIVSSKIQSDWMKKYIDFNTEKRRNAAISFEKDFFKLMINSVFGKTMENLRKRTKVRIVNNERDFLKYTSRPTHITHRIFDKNHAVIHEINPVLWLNKTL